METEDEVSQLDCPVRPWEFSGPGIALWCAIFQVSEHQSRQHDIIGGLICASISMHWYIMSTPERKTPTLCCPRSSGVPVGREMAVTGSFNQSLHGKEKYIHTCACSSHHKVGTKAPGCVMTPHDTTKSRRRLRRSTSVALFMSHFVTLYTPYIRQYIQHKANKQAGRSISPPGHERP